MGAIDVLAMGDLLAERANASADDVDRVRASRLAIGEADEPAVVKDFLERGPGVHAGLLNLRMQSRRVHCGLRSARPDSGCWKRKTPLDPAGLGENRRWKKSTRSATPSEGGTASRGGSRKNHGAHHTETSVARKNFQITS